MGGRIMPGGELLHSSVSTTLTTWQQLPLEERILLDVNDWNYADFYIVAKGYGVVGYYNTIANTIDQVSSEDITVIKKFGKSVSGTISLCYKAESGKTITIYSAYIKKYPTSNVFRSNIANPFSISSNDWSLPDHYPVYYFQDHYSSDRETYLEVSGYLESPGTAYVGIFDNLEGTLVSSISITSTSLKVYSKSISLIDNKLYDVRAKVEGNNTIYLTSAFVKIFSQTSTFCTDYIIIPKHYEISTEEWELIFSPNYIAEENLQSKIIACGKVSSSGNTLSCSITNCESAGLVNVAAVEYQPFQKYAGVYLPQTIDGVKVKSTTVSDLSKVWLRVYKPDLIETTSKTIPFTIRTCYTFWKGAHKLANTTFKFQHLDFSNTITNKAYRANSITSSNPSEATIEITWYEQHTLPLEYSTLEVSSSGNELWSHERYVWDVSNFTNVGGGNIRIKIGGEINGEGTVIIQAKNSIGWNTFTIENVEDVFYRTIYLTDEYILNNTVEYAISVKATNGTVTVKIYSPEFDPKQFYANMLKIVFPDGSSGGTITAFDEDDTVNSDLFQGTDYFGDNSMLRACIVAENVDESFGIGTLPSSWYNDKKDSLTYQLRGLERYITFGNIEAGKEIRLAISLLYPYDIVPQIILAKFKIISDKPGILYGNIGTEDNPIWIPFSTLYFTGELSNCRWDASFDVVKQSLLPPPLKDIGCTISPEIWIVR